MRDAAGELAHRFHLLGLAQRLLRQREVLLGLLLRGDVAAAGEDALAVGRGGPGDPAIAVVFVADAQLHAGQDGALGIHISGGAGGVVVEVDEAEEVAPRHLFRRPAKQGRPGGVGGGDRGVGIDDDEEILRILPDAVALMRALGDLFLKRLVEALERGFGDNAVGDVEAFDEDAGILGAGFAEGLIHQVDKALFRHAAGVAAEQGADRAAGEGPTGLANAVEQFEEALTFDIGQRGADGLAHEIALADQFTIGVVGEFEAKLRPAQHGHEAGRALEKIGEEGALRFQRAVGCAELFLRVAQRTLGGDPPCGFDCRDEHAADAVGRGGVGHGAVAEGEVALVPLAAVTPETEGQVFGVKGLGRAAEDGLVRRFDLGPHLRPDLARGTREGGRMLVAENGAISVVVEKQEFRPPSQRHGKAGGHHDVEGEPEARRPSLHPTKRGRGPIGAARQVRQLFKTAGLEARHSPGGRHVPLTHVPNLPAPRRIVRRYFAGVRRQSCPFSA